MRILVDALGISRVGGGRSYMLPLLKSMADLDPTASFHVFSEGPVPELEMRENVRLRYIPLGNRFLARLALQAALPLTCNRLKTDVVHFLKNMTALGTGARRVATIFDLHPLMSSRTYPVSDVIYWRYVQPLALRTMHALIAISYQTAADIRAAYGTLPGVVRVIYPGIDRGFRPRGQEEVAPARARLGIGARYLLHVGAISEKKNLVPLIRAFARVKAAGYPGELVLAGPHYRKLKAVQVMAAAEVAGVAHSVRLIGKLDEDTLTRIMAGAEVFVFPSMYEGFGLVVAEAMACGVPVVAARAGAVSEVVGDVCPLVEDGSDDAIMADRVLALLANEAMRHDLGKACARRAARFSWESAARATLEVYRECLRSPAHAI